MKPLIVKTLILSVEAEKIKRKLFENVVSNADTKDNTLILKETLPNPMGADVLSGSGSDSERERPICP
jgi:hypothetical protein